MWNHRKMRAMRHKSQLSLCHCKTFSKTIPENNIPSPSLTSFVNLHHLHTPNIQHPHTFLLKDFKLNMDSNSRISKKSLSVLRWNQLSIKALGCSMTLKTDNQSRRVSPVRRAAVWAMGGKCVNSHNGSNMGRSKLYKQRNILDRSECEKEA